MNFLNKMIFNFISKNPEETSKLEKAIESLKNSRCFDVLSGSRDFNVSHKGDVIILTPLSQSTHLVLCNLYKNKDFKIDNVDVQ